MRRWERGTVVGNRRWTEGLHSLEVEAPIDPFRAGQFTRLALEVDGERIARPYSYVNAPHESVLEFYFNTVPSGPLSNKLSALSSGDPIWVAPRAVGQLTLAQVPEAQHLWLKPAALDRRKIALTQLARTPDQASDVSPERSRS